MNKIFVLLFLILSNTYAMDGIEAIGYGDTKDKALRSAFQNAVEQSVSIYVDSTTVIKNSKLIKNNILTFSKGYISYYTVLSSKKQMGLWEVKISAVVKEQKILKTVKKLKLKPKSIKNSEQTYARLVSQVKSKFDAEDLMMKFVKDTLKSLVTLRVDSLNLNMEMATRKFVPATIKWSEVYNLDTYIQVSQEFVNLIKNLGAKKVGSFQMNGRYVDDFKASKNSICVVLIKNEKREVTMWQFPNSYAVVKPIEMYSGWNRDCESQYSYKLSLVNSKNKSIWESENYLPKNIQMFNYLNNGILSVRFTQDESRGDFSAISPYSDGSKRRAVIVSGSLDIQLPIDEIKDLKQAKAVWIDR